MDDMTIAHDYKEELHLQGRYFCEECGCELDEVEKENCRKSQVFVCSNCHEVCND